jgi:hypothetical protein
VANIFLIYKSVHVYTSPVKKQHLIKIYGYDAMSPERYIPEKPVDQGADYFPRHFLGGVHCLLQKHQHEGQCFSEGRLLQFFATGVKQGSKRSGILFRPLGRGQHDVSAAHHGGMGDQRVIGPPLAFFSETFEFSNFLFLFIFLPVF